MADLSARKRRIEEIQDRILTVIERATQTMRAASYAPALENPEVASELTVEEQTIAQHALLPSKDVPFYLVSAAKIVAAGAANVTKPEEAPKAQLNVQVVNVATSVEAWQKQRKVLHDPSLGTDVAKALLEEKDEDE